jgi:hypothetical protein
MDWIGCAHGAVRVDVLRARKEDQLIGKCRAKHHQEKGCDYGQDKIWWPAFDRRKNVFVMQRPAHIVVTRSQTEFGMHAARSETKSFENEGWIANLSLGTRWKETTGKMPVGPTGSEPDWHFTPVVRGCVYTS